MDQGKKTERLIDIRAVLIEKLNESIKLYDEMVIHKRGKEFKAEFIKGWEMGGMFIIDGLFAPDAESSGRLNEIGLTTLTPTDKTE